MKTKTALATLLMVVMPFCASSAWREGFKNADTLQLIGEGQGKADLPETQATAMAREAAVIDALSHWRKYCGDAEAPQFKVENQKKRMFKCTGISCQARVIIEQNNLRAKCGK